MPAVTSLPKLPLLTLILAVFFLCLGLPPHLRAQHFSVYKSEHGEFVTLYFTGEKDWTLYRDDPVYRRLGADKLDSVVLNNHRVSIDEIKHLASLKNLDDLSVGDAPEGVEMEKGALEGVGTLSNLESLQLCVADLKDDDLSFLAQLKNLKFLRIQSSSPLEKPGHLTDRAATTIARLAQLESLEIAGDLLTDDFVTAILRLPKISKLTIYSESLTDDSLHRLAKTASLAELRTSSPKFTRAGLRDVLDSPSLKSIDVDFTNMKFQWAK